MCLINNIKACPRLGGLGHEQIYVKFQKRYFMKFLDSYEISYKRFVLRKKLYYINLPNLKEYRKFYLKLKITENSKLYLRGGKY